MINLLVVSDTHGNYKKLEEVLKKQFALDENHRPRHIVHLGDGIEDIEKCSLAERFCVQSVKGNCDSFFYSSSVPTEHIIELGGYKMLIMHGHTRSVKLGVSLAAEHAADCGADILMYGHTHVPVSYTLEKGTEVGDTMLKKSLTVFNPGSLEYGGSFGAISLSDRGIFCSLGNLN